MSERRSWLRGHPALLLPEDQLGLYPGEAVRRPKPPAVAFEVVGEGYRGLAVHDTESTTFLPREAGGVIGQLLFSDSADAACDHLLASFPAEGFKDLGFIYEATTERHLLFDSVFAGAALSDPDELLMMEEMGVKPIRIDLPVGRYAVRGRVGYSAEPNAEWSLIELLRTE